MTRRDKVSFPSYLRELDAVIWRSGLDYAAGT